MARTTLLKKAVTRKKGKLYFINSAGDVVETDMNRTGGKKGRHICSSKKRKPAKKKKAAKAKHPFYSAVDSFVRLKKRKVAAKKSAVTRRRKAKKRK